MKNFIRIILAILLTPAYALADENVKPTKPEEKEAEEVVEAKENDEAEVEEGDGGYLVYMAGHEGRGIGLWAKAATYILQDEGENTYQANKSLGLDEDCRDFSDAAALLHYFVGERPIRLLTNNPKKVNDLKSFGLKYITPTKHLAGINQNNKAYLAAKRDWGHLIDDDEIKGFFGILLEHLRVLSIHTNPYQALQAIDISLIGNFGANSTTRVSPLTQSVSLVKAKVLNCRQIYC